MVPIPGEPPLDTLHDVILARRRSTEELREVVVNDVNRRRSQHPLRIESIRNVQRNFSSIRRFEFSFESTVRRSCLQIIPAEVVQHRGDIWGESWGVIVVRVPTPRIPVRRVLHRVRSEPGSDRIRIHSQGRPQEPSDTSSGHFVGWSGSLGWDGRPSPFWLPGRSSGCPCGDGSGNIALDQDGGGGDAEYEEKCEEYANSKHP